PCPSERDDHLARSGRAPPRPQGRGARQRPGPPPPGAPPPPTHPGGGGGPAPSNGGAETSLFTGVDTTIHVAGFATLVDSARAALTPWRPAATLPYLVRALRLLGTADSLQRALLERAIATAAGITVDGTADDEIVVPGERLQVEVTVWNAGDSTVRVDSVSVAAPAGWTLERVDFGAPTLAPGGLQTRRFALTVARDAERTQP